MNKLALLVIAILAIGAYMYRDRLPTMQTTNNASEAIYTWKDRHGKVHYSSDKSSLPAHAQRAELPGISVIESNREELEKQAQRLRDQEKSATPGDVDKPKLPEVRNLALERMDKAAGAMKK